MTYKRTTDFERVFYLGSQPVRLRPWQFENTLLRKAARCFSLAT
jgi:hypothetical protein